MIVLWEQRLVFLATPKTGSTALAAALAPHAAMVIERPPLLKHTTLHRYHRFIRPYLEAASKDNWQVVAVMREPLDWLGSWYRFRQRDETIHPSKSTKHLSFDDFVSGWCAENRPAFADIGSQSRFLRPRQSQGLDHLFRYEDMAGLVGFFEDRLQKPLHLDQLNVSPPGDLTLSDPIRSAFTAHAKEDYALYHGIGQSL